VTTIETSEITYLNNNIQATSPSSPTPSRQSISKKRSSSTRRLPFATISNNTPDQIDNEDVSFKCEQNLLSPNLSPNIIFNSNLVVAKRDEANGGEEIDININDLNNNNNNDGNNNGLNDNEWNETKNNINYAKQGFAFVRSTKSNSFRHRRSFIKKR